MGGSGSVLEQSAAFAAAASAGCSTPCFPGSLEPATPHDGGWSGLQVAEGVQWGVDTPDFPSSGLAAFAEPGAGQLVLLLFAWEIIGRRALW